MKLEAKRIPQSEVPEVFKAAHEGDQEAVEVLLKNTIGLIRKLAGKYQGPQVTAEDLEQIGILGLYKGIRNGNYNPEKGMWSTWAYYWVRGAILEEIQERRTIIRVPRARSYGKKRLDLNFSAIDDVKENLTVLDEEADFSENLEHVSKNFSRLSPIQAYILRERFYGDRNFKAIGEDLGISKQAVHSSYHRALSVLRHAS